MSDKESIELEEQYDDCSHLKERTAHISKEFESYNEHWTKLSNIMPTVEREINSDSNDNIDIYPESEQDNDFYLSFDVEVNLNDASTEEGTYTE